ncbi:MAG: LuxR C-terminal-related transcriptional regulator [Chthoniobacterales bacterium]
MRSTDHHRPVARLAATFSHLLSLGVTQRDTYLAVIRSVLDANPTANGIWSVWEPNALDGRDVAYQHAPGHDATGRFVPHWHRTRGHAKLDPVTGYAERRLATWYQIPFQSAELCAVDPYFYPIDNGIHRITSEVAPIVAEGRCLGVAGIDHIARSTPRPADALTAAPRVRSLATEAHAALTPREREVHHWLSEGKSNDEIATVLGISPHTVKNHLDHIFQKLGVENRLAAITVRSQ